jgi:hypothetical protein
LFVEIQGDRELESVERTEAMRKTLPPEQAFRDTEMVCRYTENLEFIRRHVQKHPRSKTSGLSARDDAASDFPREYGLNFQQSQNRDANGAVGFREDRQHLRRANLWVVALGKRTGVQKVIGQLPVLALGGEVLGERVRDCRQHPVDLLQRGDVRHSGNLGSGSFKQPHVARAPARIGGGHRDSHALRIRQVQRLQRAQHAIFVYCFHVLNHATILL